MTAEIRTAARAETEATAHFGPPDFSAPNDRTIKWATYVQGFTEGAVWAQARVTPTREQIAEALWNLPINVITMKQLKEQAASGAGDYRETLDYVYEQADSVLALMQELAEG